MVRIRVSLSCFLKQNKKNQLIDKIDIQRQSQYQKNFCEKTKLVREKKTAIFNVAEKNSYIWETTTKTVYNKKVGRSEKITVEEKNI